MSGVDAPWKLVLELRRRAALPLVYLRLRLSGLEAGRGWKLFGAPIVQRQLGSTIAIGDRLCLRSWPESNPLAPNHPVVLATRSPRAIIRIADDFSMTGGTVCAAERIEIGSRVFVGANCTIVDTDFHPIDPDHRRRAPQDARTAPVLIDDDVFIGMDSIILKGVRIGSGSVIGAGSVVTEDVPPYVVCAGNPARIVRELRPDTVEAPSPVIPPAARSG